MTLNKDNSSCDIIIKNAELISSMYNNETFLSTFEEGSIGILKRLSEHVYIVKEAKKVEGVNKLNNHGKFIISRELSFSLLKLCKEKSLIPIISHTHPINYKDLFVSFSEGDMKFIDSFVTVARKMEIYESLFMVTNGIYTCNLFYLNDKVFKWTEKELM